MKSTSGNVLVYVLLAVVLFGALSFTLTKQLGSGSGMTGTLDTNKARLRAEELINYATAARSTVEQMRTMSNLLPNEFSFVKQGDAGYDTAPHKAKVYHPVGGGLNVFTPTPEMFASGSDERGWVAQVGTNVDFTQTTGSDIIFTFLDVNPAVCKAINERLFKDTAIPTTTLDASKVFINGGGDDDDFETSDCSSCTQRTSYCVIDSDGNNAFYNVILAR